MIKQYNVTVNGTTYEVTVESAAGGRMNAGHGILGVMLISVKEMLSIEDHLFTHPL